MGNERFKPTGDPSLMGKETRTVKVERDDNYEIWHCLDCDEDLGRELKEEGKKAHEGHNIDKLMKYPVRKVVIYESEDVLVP